MCNVDYTNIHDVLQHNKLKAHALCDSSTLHIHMPRILFTTDLSTHSFPKSFNLIRECKKPERDAKDNVD